MTRLSSAALIAMLVASPAFAQDQSMSADLADAEGNAHGTVEAMPTPSGMMHVTIALTDVEPGIYGAHLHETGLCESPDFKSAGGHLAQEGEEHGVLSEAGPHIGDMPNVHVPETGAITVEYFVPDLGADLVADDDGTAFMLHAKADDLESQPSGDAGDRMACAVLAAASGN